MPDGQKGWFLPNDDLKHVEHPEEGAKRILREQVGIEPSTLKLAQIESFVGNNKSLHLVFDFLEVRLSRTMTKPKNGLDDQRHGTTQRHITDVVCQCTKLCVAAGR